MGGLDAELAGDGSVEIEGRDGGVAEVEDEVVGARQGHAQVAHRRGLADAGLGGEDAEAGLVDELPEGAPQADVAGRLVVEGLALCILGKWIAAEIEAVLLGHAHSSSSSSWGWGSARAGRVRR